MNKQLHFFIQQTFIEQLLLHGASYKLRVQWLRRQIGSLEVDIIQQSTSFFNYNCEKCYKREVLRAERTQHTLIVRVMEPTAIPDTLCISLFKPHSKALVLFPLLRSGNRTQRWGRLPMQIPSLPQSLLPSSHLAIGRKPQGPGSLRKGSRSTSSPAFTPDFALLIFFFSFFFFFNWSIVGLQRCANLFCTAKWLSYTHILF